jgi:hypothetical protein
MMKVKEIETLLFIETGAPVPVILSNEYKFYLFYYYQRTIGSSGNTDLPRQRDSNADRGVAVVTFPGFLIYKFGYPNVEALQGHPYYSLGFRSYSLFEVIDSDWVQDIEQRNRIHPRHNRERYKAYRHFLIAFEDSTFECIAKSMEIEFKPNMTMMEALGIISSQMG